MINCFNKIPHDALSVYSLMPYYVLFIFCYEVIYYYIEKLDVIHVLKLIYFFLLEVEFFGRALTNGKNSGSPGMNFLRTSGTIKPSSVW